MSRQIRRGLLMTGFAGTEGLGLSKKKLAAGVAIILTLLTCVFLPEVDSLVWHLIHGKIARFHEWEVSVPWGWSAMTNEDTLIVQRMHRFNFRSSQVVVAPLTFPPTFEFGRWKRATIQTQLKRGFRFISEHKIRLDNKDGFCFAFAAVQNPQRLWITCDVPELHLSVGFIGHETDASVLDLIIQHITRTKSSTSGHVQVHQYDAKGWANESYVRPPALPASRF